MDAAQRTWEASCDHDIGQVAVFCCDHRRGLLICGHCTDGHRARVDGIERAADGNGNRVGYGHDARDR